MSIWKSNILSPMKDILRSLLSQGFEVYRYEDELVPITERDINYSPAPFACYREYIHLFTPDDIYNYTGRTLKIPRDQILILDDAWVDSLINPTIERKSRLSLEYFYRFLHTYHGFDLLLYFQLCQIKFAEIVQETCSTEMEGVLLFLTKKYPEARVQNQVDEFLFTCTNHEKIKRAGLLPTILEKIKTITVYTFNVSKTIEAIQEFKNLTTLVINKPWVHQQELENLTEIFNAKTFTTLTHLKLLEDIDHHCLSFLLKCAPSLKELHLSTIRTNELHLTDRILKTESNLTEVICNKSINFEDLENLLLYSPKLKTLTIKLWPTGSNLLNLPEKHLSQLKKLELKTSAIDFRNLQILLAACPNLEYLDISECQNIKEEQTESLKTLPLLTYLDISYSSLSNRCLIQLLKESYFLKTLEASNYDFEEKLIGLPPFNSLELLNLNDCDLDSENLYYLIKSASSLKELYLVNFQNEFITAFPDKLNLPSLKKIVIETYKISFEVLIALFQSAPHLKHIILKDNIYIGKIPKKINFTLNELKILSLHTETKLNFLNLLLSMAPYLESFEFCYSSLHKHDEAAFIEQTHLFPALQNIRLDNVKIKYSNLVSFLSACPEIKTFAIHNSIVISGQSRPEKLISMRHASILELCNTRIDAQKLLYLLTFFPFLKELSLDSSHARGRIKKRVALPMLEKLNLSSTKIDFEFLQQILNASKKLKTLNLHKYLNLDKSLYLDKLSLPFLTNLNVGQSNINLDNLNVLFKATPYLKSLNIINTQFPSGNTTLTAPPIGYLEGYWEYSEFLNNLSIENKNLIVSNVKDEEKRKRQRFYTQNEEYKQLYNLHEFIYDVEDRYPNCLDQSRTEKQENSSFSTLSFLSFAFHNLISKRSVPYEQNVNESPFDYKQFFNIESKTDFHFQNISNSNLSQQKIIELLSQYLLVTNRNRSAIPLLQNGICNALAYLFKSLNEPEWRTFLTIVHWDGQLNSLTDEYRVWFDRLWRYVEQYQFKPTPSNYLGDNCTSSFSFDKTYLVKNPWHTIAIKPYDNEHWLFYDPNSTTGVKIIHVSKLEQQLHYTLGNLICSEEDLVKPIKIKDLNQFIAEGGLRILAIVDNREQILKHFEQGYYFHPKAHQGLFLKNTDGVPAWVIALKHPELNSFTLNLLDQYYAYEKEHAKNSLLDSLKSIPYKDKKFTLSDLSTLSKNKKQKFSKVLSDVIISQTLSPEYLENELTTWVQTKKYFDTVDGYVAEIVNDLKKNLVIVQSTKQLYDFCFHIKKYFWSKSIPIFYVSQPSDLTCSAPYIKRAQDIGLIAKGPGGPLYQFLQQEKNNAPIILINYEKFTVKEIIKFNSLFDKYAHIDGTALPKGTKILAVMNKK